MSIRAETVRRGLIVSRAPASNPQHQGAGDVVEGANVGAFLQQMMQSPAAAGLEDQSEAFDAEDPPH